MKKYLSKALSLVSLITIPFIQNALSNERTVVNEIELRNLELGELDLSQISPEEKENIIKELLEMNSEALMLIPNNDLNNERYRSELGSHAFKG